MMAHTLRGKALCYTPNNFSTEQLRLEHNREVLQLDNSHQPTALIRRLITQNIEAYLRGTKEFCNYHPDLLLSISRIIDEELVRDAQTEVQYTNLSTLPNRVNAVLSSVSFGGQRDSWLTPAASSMQNLHQNGIITQETNIKASVIKLLGISESMKRSREKVCSVLCSLLSVGGDNCVDSSWYFFR